MAKSSGLFKLSRQAAELLLTFIVRVCDSVLVILVFVAFAPCAGDCKVLYQTPIPSTSKAIVPVIKIRAA